MFRDMNLREERKNYRPYQLINKYSRKAAGLKRNPFGAHNDLTLIKFPAKRL
jgi:hypothetical protein